jgi:3-oxoacyl-[acyl-carrier-protein] synthase II
LGESVPDVFAALCDGQSGIGPVQRFDTTDYDVHFGGECLQFDYANYVPRALVRERPELSAKRLDRFAQFGLAAAVAAVRDAGLDFDAEDRARCGVIVGSGIGGLAEIEEQHSRLLAGGPSRVRPFLVPKLMANAGSGNISIFFRLHGPCSSTVTACASGANAMGDALRAIQRGEADVMITGGAEAALTPIGLSGFCSLKALSTRNDDPVHASRPFDADRDGFVLSEGAGIVVFEALEHARARGARIYGEVVGFGMSGDGCSIAAPHPEGYGAALSMRRALEDAGLQPAAVDYINAHGTGTPPGDQAEATAIVKVFGEGRPAVSSTKSQIGHLLGASGGVEGIFCLVALNERRIPPNVNYDTPDPACPLDIVHGAPREADLQYVMSNSFGFGGHNATLIFARYTD